MLRVLARPFNSYAVLKPAIDFDARLNDLTALRENVKRRRLTGVNVDEILSFREKVKSFETIKTRLEDSRQLVRDHLTRIDPNDSHGERRWKILAKILREDHKEIKSTVSDLERNLFRLMMTVPNELHPKTQDEDVVFHCVAAAEECGQSHLEVGAELNLIDYKNSWAYFLKDQAAFFELRAVTILTNILKKRGFISFASPDVVRRLVVDGCEGANFSATPLVEFEDDSDTSYLTGGASVLPFMSFFAKNSFRESTLPVRCQSAGRQYNCDNGFPDAGLYGAVQSNAVQLFVCSTPSDEDAELNALVDDLISFYEQFHVPFRVVTKKAASLRVAESLRVSFELYSPHYGRHFECAHVSLYGCHLSRTMNVRCIGGSDNFPCVMSGTAVRVAPLLACILENSVSLPSSCEFS